MVYGFYAESAKVHVSGIVSDRYICHGVAVCLTKTQIKRALSRYYDTSDVFVSEDEEGQYAAEAEGINLCIPQNDKWWNGRLSLYEDVIELEDGNTYQSGRQPFGYVEPLSCIQIARQKYGVSNCCGYSAEELLARDGHIRE